MMASREHNHGKGERLNGSRGYHKPIEDNMELVVVLGVVLTLIAAVPDAAWVTEMLEGGPVQVALTGAPAQLTATLSRSAGDPPTRERASE